MWVCHIMYLDFVLQVPNVEDHETGLRRHEKQKTIVRELHKERLLIQCNSLPHA